MKMKSVFFAFLLMSSTVFAATQLESSQAIPDDAIVQDGSSLNIELNGYKLKSMEQVHKVLATALAFPPSYDNSLEALRALLVNPKTTPLKTQISIVGGESLRLEIGNDQLAALLEVLNDAEDKNLDEVGGKNLTIYFFQ